MLTQALLEDSRAIADRITALRRAIHAEPELGLETPRTLAKVKADLADLPLEWREGPSCTGAVAVLNAGKAGKCVLLRGDMDALPMDELTGLDFASTIPGRMHACGHDTHTAMLAGAARVLAARADELAGEVRFMFQPGEEGYHGARFMLEDGLLGGGVDGVALPDAAFALHIMPNAPHGTIGGRSGTLLAAADMIEITVTGRGGHASMPHDTRDPVPVACEIVLALQTMVTRRFDAAEAVVVTITQLDAGSAHNIVPDLACLKGTMRTLTPGNRAAVRAGHPAGGGKHRRSARLRGRDRHHRRLPADDLRSARGGPGRGGRHGPWRATSCTCRADHGRRGFLLRARKGAGVHVLPRRGRGQAPIGAPAAESIRAA